MEKDLIQKWDANKDKLREWFSTHTHRDVRTYLKIVRAICEVVFEWKQRNESYWQPEREEYDVTEVKHQKYQGNSIFVIYHPDTCYDLPNFIITHNEYGSCSGCDTLMAILGDWLTEDENNQILDDEQVKDLMTLSLHLVQRMFRIDYDFNNEED